MSNTPSEAVPSGRDSRMAFSVGLVVVVAIAIGLGAWHELSKSDVVAYMHVGHPEPLLPSVGESETPDEYRSLKRTTAEYMRSKSLLIRALRDRAVSQLTLVTEQSEPVQWLQDNLSVEYPNDAEILQITLRSHRPEDAVKVVDAVVDAFFKEVVEKGVTDRARTEEKLRLLLDDKTQLIVRERKEVQRMREALGGNTPPDYPEIEVKLAHVRQLEAMAGELDARLQQIQLQKYQPPRIERIEGAIIGLPRR